MFKLSQIEMDIRRNLEEETKDDKVHKKNDFPVKNNKNSKPFVDEIDVENKQKVSKRFLTINGEKHSGKYVEIKAEKNGETVGNALSGIFIDNIK